MYIYIYIYIYICIYMASFSMVNFKLSLVENQGLPFISSRSKMFFKVGILKSYAILKGKNLRWSFVLIKFQSFRSATLLKRKL